MNKTASPTQLVTSIIESTQPEAILYIGIGDPDILEQVCRATRENPAVVITLIQPNLHDNPRHADVLQRLKEQGLDSNIEFMSTSADEVLPDLYFQELSFDLAILNPCQDQDETFVSFYYINKMLPQNGCIILPDTNNDITRKLSRQLITDAGYKIQHTANAKPTMTYIERLVRNQYQRIPESIRHQVEKVIRDDIVVTDEQLGLDGTFVVFQKSLADDPLDVQVDQLVAAYS